MMIVISITAESQNNKITSDAEKFIANIYDDDNDDVDCLV